LPAPSPQSFGIEHYGTPGMRIALAQNLERHVVREGEAALPAWPRVVVYAVPPATTVLPVPGTQVFRYARAFHAGKPDKPRVANKSKKPGTKSVAPKEPAKDPAVTGTVPASKPPADGPPRPPRPIGHQLTVIRPPATLTSY